MPAGQPRPYLVPICPNFGKSPKNGQNPDFMCFTCSWCLLVTPSRRCLNTDETYSRSSVAGEALSSYNRVHRDFANRPDTSISLSKFLKQKRIPERSFYRKKKIAELIILDRPRFDSLIKQILKEERTDRINQQILSDRCGAILKQSDFLEKKRLAIAAGKIL